MQGLKQAGGQGQICHLPSEVFLVLCGIQQVCSDYD